MEADEASASGKVTIPDDIAARCNGSDQAERMEKLFRAVIAVPKSAILKEEAKWTRSRAKAATKKRKQPA